MRPQRPMRSVWLGNLRYLSAYGLGVAQAMGVLGHWHRSVSIFDEPSDIAREIAEMRPDVIWTHMTLWPPPGACGVEDLTSILAMWKSRGTAVYLHDGDPREARQPSVDIGFAYSIALVNKRLVDGRYYGINAAFWPYAAMVQKEIAPPSSEWNCDLLFAGHLRRGSEEDIYDARTTLVLALQERLGGSMRIVCPTMGETNNRMLVADVAASANAVLGYARPNVPGWIDTRVFQYPGAGGVLIHDDAGEYLIPDEHYLRFDRDDAVDSILRAVERARTEGPAIRERAFRYVQANHTWVHRVEVALTGFFGIR